MNGLSLFANVGIGETYFKDIGINICVANELLKIRGDFYKHLYPETEVVIGDFSNITIKSKLEELYKYYNCEFIIATPPCQGMSTAGKRNTKDKRNLLIIDTIEFVKKVKPKYVLIENVPQIINTKIEYKGGIVEIPKFIINELEPLGYKIDYQVLDSADYNTPQHRKRAIFLIRLKNLRWNFPKKSKLISVGDAIGDLPSLESGEDSGIIFHKAKKHTQRQIDWMKHTPTGQSALNNPIHFPTKDGRKIKGFSTTYKRIHWFKPAPTITMANGSISSQNNVHPGRLNADGTYSDARVLSLLEIFRLTGLPDNWNVPVNATENLIRQVVGESFPPMFAKEILQGI